MSNWHGIIHENESTARQRVSRSEASEGRDTHLDDGPEVAPLVQLLGVLGRLEAHLLVLRHGELQQLLQVLHLARGSVVHQGSQDRQAVGNRGLRTGTGTDRERWAFSGHSKRRRNAGTAGRGGGMPNGAHHIIYLFWILSAVTGQ